MLHVFSNPHLRKKFDTKWQLKAVILGGHTLPAHALGSLGVMEIVQDESPVQDLKRSQGGDKASSY